MELFGVLCLTVLALLAIVVCIGVPYIGLGFGGPTASNWALMIGGLIISASIAFGWWVVVGSEIHLGYG